MTIAWIADFITLYKMTIFQFHHFFNFIRLSYFVNQTKTKHLSFSGAVLLSRVSRVRLCVTPQTAAHQAPLSLGFSSQEHWSGLPVPSPMHESEKWKWSRSVVSDPQLPHGLQPTRLLHPWDFPGKSTGVGCHCLLRIIIIIVYKYRSTHDRHLF